MVSDVAIESPVETPEAPPVEEAPAAPAVEETLVDTSESPPAPVEEPTEEVVAPPPDLAAEIAALRAELAEVKGATQKPQRSEAEIKAEIEANLVAQRQVEEAQRQQEQAWKEELNESLGSLLVTTGYGEVEPEKIRAIGERFINKRYDQIANKTVGDVRDALQWIRQGQMGEPQSTVLTPRAAEYAKQLIGMFGDIHAGLRASIEPEARKGYIAESDLPARVEAEIAKRAAKSREGQEPLVRPEGTPSTVNKNSLEYWEGRIAREGEEGHPDMSASDWATYKAIRRQHGLS